MAKIAFILLCHKDPDAVIEQAERLTYSMVNGSVWLTLVPTDFVETPTDGITLCTLFPDLGALAEEFPGLESACADN